MSEMNLEELPVEAVPILSGDVPVIMPDLPAQLTVNTLQQFKALNDPVRSRILAIVRHKPATAKQLATVLKATPGAIGHHLKVLEEAGLVQVVARRLIRGIVARYYTRTARIFNYDLPQELEASVNVDILTRARDELSEASLNQEADPYQLAGFPHARLTPERAAYYQTRLNDLILEMLQEPVPPDGSIYAMCMALFMAPDYIQQNLAEEPA